MTVDSKPYVLALATIVGIALLASVSFVLLRSNGDGQPSSQSPVITSEIVTTIDGQTTSTTDDKPNAQVADRPDSLESMRNEQDKFDQFSDVVSTKLPYNELTEPAGAPDNGASPVEGQFRIACEYSHFAYDDPILKPGQPGASHLHMFFGNTLVDAFTTDESLVDTGGGTCQGFELNRSAYWVPALLDGRGNAVVPDYIIIYYKSRHPEDVVPLPQGLQMIAGNTTSSSFETRDTLHWSCGGSGNKFNVTNRIPECGGDTINASIQFANCWDGVNLRAPDHTSHLLFIGEQDECPASHPQRLPQISFLLYFPGTDSVDGWHLSSDDMDSFNAETGRTLHADWWGGWNDEALRVWNDNCMKAVRNCSLGQTGTERQLASLNALEGFEGDNLVALPSE